MSKINRQWLLVVILFLSTVTSAPAGEKLNPAAPSVLPGTNRDVKSPGFWIGRHPSPDSVILSSAGIQSFNQQLSKDGLTKDLFSIDAFDLNVSKTQIQKEIQKFKHGDYFDREGKLVSRYFFKRLQKNLNIDDIKDIVPRYAFVLKQSDQRLLPTQDILTAEPFDFEFDEIQNSSLDAGEPVVVFYETLDEKWVYTQTSASAGWVKKENLLFVSSDEFKNLLLSENFVVVMSAKADLYLDPSRKKFYDYVRMGTKLTVNETIDDIVEVIVAPGQNLYISRQDVHPGFLPYTPRTIIEQAFNMLNEPYGWGGMNGEQDCSSFLKSVFATVGISLPRNSTEQGKVGKAPAAFSKSNTRGQVAFLAEALPGITVAQMKGHIVLYLGMYDNRPFAIHEGYAYREPQRVQADEPQRVQADEPQRVQTGELVDREDRVRVFNRVAVSDLNLGKGSKKGSLLERIIAVREVR